MVNIAIVTTHPFNYSAGTTVRVKEIAYELAKSGCNIYILNPFEKSSIIQDKVTVINIPNLMFKLGISNLFYKFNRKTFNNTLSNKILLNKTYIQKSSIILAKNIEPILKEFDIEIIQAEQEIAALACINLNDKYKVISDLHNLWAEELVASKSITSNSNIYETIKGFEKKIIEESDSTVVVSDALKDFLITKYNIKPHLINVSYNGARKNISKEHYTKNPSKVVYSGMLDYRQKVDLFVNAIPFIKKNIPLAEFYISKNGDQKDKIIKLIKQKKIFVNLTWFERDDDYYNFIKVCDIGVLTSSQDIPRQLGTPTKLFNYMAAGIPVVANNIGGWTSIIEENKIGLLTKNEPQDFADKIIELLNNPEKLERLGRNGVQLINKKFNWEKSAEKFLRIYDSQK